MISGIKSAGAVYFHELVSVRLKERRRLKEFIREGMGREKHRLQQLDFVFCDDAYLLEINRQFLKHDDYTDIITFDLSIDEGVVGEIYISVERVRENAKSFETSFEKELHRVMFHGVLHLCGFKDKSPVDKPLMRKKEDQWLKRYFG